VSFMTATSTSPLRAPHRERFIERLRTEGLRRYHHAHPFHRRMHTGLLSPDEIRLWVANRYYYQTRIPIKDALILSKSDDPGFRRTWIRRIHDHDGNGDDEGGLSLWWRLGDAVGIPREELLGCRAVLPGVRSACDDYVALVRDASLVEAVASSLTEFFAPDLLRERVLAWEQHYPWVRSDALDYFRQRVPRARRDSEEALTFVVNEARSAAMEDRCVAALVAKAEILWQILDSIDGARGARA
jgi:pyrroloquinoline-quinone synthase